MDPKKKRIYIILIITCFGLSAVILGWSKFSSPSVDVDGAHLVNPSSSPVGLGSREATGDSTKGYLPPAVFPINESFKSNILDSSKFQTLKPYSLLDVTGELGRTDPFISY